MKHALLAIFSVLLFNFQSLASTPRERFELLRTAISNNDYDATRALLTPDSYPLFDKFRNYGLMGCIPANITYHSENKIGNDSYVLAVPADSKSGVRLAFTQSNNEWMLSLPMSLHNGLGEKWQKRVNMIEQLYLLLKAQWGENLDCAMIQGVVEQQATPQ